MDSVDIKDKSVEIHLVGPGFGEALLVIIGRTLAIGIDSCVSLTQQRGKDGKQSYIESCLGAFTGRLYWILTHYHYDHFQSLSQVLLQFRDRLTQAAFPTDYTSDDIAFAAMAEEAKYHNSRSSELMNSTKGELSRAKGEYGRIKSLISDRSFKRKIVRQFEKGEWISLKLKLPSGESIRLQVDLYGIDTSTYYRRFQKAFTTFLNNGKLSKDGANDGSYVAHIKAGQFEGLFLADAKSARVSKLLKRMNGRKNRTSPIDCIKVAHHGSREGTDKRLLRLCTGGDAQSQKKRLALIAPYKQQRLPCDDVIRMLNDSGYEVRQPSTVQVSVDRIATELRSAIRSRVTEAYGAPEHILKIDDLSI